MTSPDDLLNKGFIVNRESGEQGRTFIVSGLERSGISLIASFLQQAGIFIGRATWQLREGRLTG